MTKEQKLSPLSLDPIGIIKTAKQVKFDAPHQPDRKSSESSTVELFPKKGMREALQDLKGFEYIWLIWWFHRNNNWRPMVLPPRGPQKRRGVFATRSPYRPNPLGITAVKLLGVKGLKLTIGAHDLVDGTPILDIKPYLSSADAFPNAASGWLAEVEAALAEPPKYKIAYAEPAKSQLQWLEAAGINFIDRARELLERDPSPHRTRRITKAKKGGYRMGCGAWRVHFTVEGHQVLVQSISTGFPRKLLLDKGYSEVPDRNEQLAFDAIWPESS